MKFVWGVLLALVWTAGVVAATLIALGDFGTGIGAAMAAIYMVGTAGVALPLALVGAWVHHRRYHDLRVLPILGVAAIVAVVLVVGDHSASHRPPTSTPLPPLHAASHANDIDRVRALLDDGADVNERDPQGRTAAAYAAEQGSLELFEALSARGANLPTSELISRAAFNPDARLMRSAVADGIPAGQEQSAGSALRVALCLPNAPVVSLLLEAGATTGQLGGPDDPLAIAASCGETSLFSLLLGGEASLSRALLVAVDENEPRSVRTLINMGADPNPRVDPRGPSPLGLGIRGMNVELIRALVEGGGALDRPTGDVGDQRSGWPLEIAMDTHDLPTLELLLTMRASLPGRDLPTLVDERGAAAVARSLNDEEP